MVNNGMIIWLVVYLLLWKMMEFVSWGYDIPNMMGKSSSSCSKPPSRIDIHRPQVSGKIVRPGNQHGQKSTRFLHGKCQVRTGVSSHGADDTPADTIYVYYVYYILIYKCIYDIQWWYVEIGVSDTWSTPTAGCFISWKQTHLKWIEPN